MPSTFPAGRHQIAFAAESHVGRKRAHNEDSFLLPGPERLAIVADGMGGHEGGEVAAALAIEVFREYGALYREKDAVAGLRALVADANERIYAKAQTDLRHKGMGTTVVAALVHDDAVTIAHVGDSRAYRLRGGELELLTRDHSYVAELVEMGALTPEQAEKHPGSSVITRAVGTRPEVEADVETLGVQDQDVFLLCSDGLTKMVAEAEVKAIVTGARRLEDASERLIAAANEGGGEDNVTVCLFRVTLPEAQGRRQTTVVELSVIARAATADRRAR